MTRNEALEELKTFPVSCLDFKENQALQVAIKALEEIQQYRALETVEELKTFKDGFAVDFANMGYEKGYADGYADAIDEFAEKLLEKAPRNWAGELELGGATCYLSANKVKEIAEQMKGSE